LIQSNYKINDDKMKEMMTKPKVARLALAFFIAVLLTSIFNPAVFAHPLGQFTVNHFSRLQISNERISLRYIVDMAEIPAFQTLQAIDTDNDGKPSADELKAYAEKNATRYAEGLLLSVDDAPLAFQPLAHTITTPAGTGGLPTLRIEYDFVANVQTSGVARRQVRFEDTNDKERIGWHEIAIAPNSNIAVFDSTAFANSISDELKAYPEDLLAAPLNERKAELSYTLGAIPANAKALLTREGRAVTPTRDRFAELISVPELTFPVALLGLLIAAFLGGVHAMSPGHGKTVVGAYLVGSRGTPKHAAFLGLTVTITHTLGVFALGLATLFASQYVVPEKLFPVISLLSGLIVFALGLSLFVKRLRGAMGFAAADHHHDHDEHGHHHEHGHSHDHHSHEHGEHHQHDHEHSHDHHHGHQHSHTHSADEVHAHAHHSHSHQPQLALAHSHEQHAHSHGEEPAHTHEHHDHDQSHSHDHAGVNPADSGLRTADPGLQTPDAGLRQAFVHSHDGGKPHSHLPPGADGSSITWKNLLALGISGGLLPCPSALVVLLSAIYMERTGYGLLLVIAFSAGLAATLTGVGLMFLYAGRLLKRPAGVRNHTLTRILPVLSALVIACVGAVMCYEAFVTSGFK
jgi:nickel/cobalt transporter (NicO) family protein